MPIINIHSESEIQKIPPIPGWTGFNILLLQDQIPARSNIGYLPAVNGNPIKLIIVNAVFLQILDLADELETGCIVLTFDTGFNSLQNPFTYIETELINIASGHIAHLK